MSTQAVIPLPFGELPTRQAGMKANDFASDQQVRWCPGCGDYSILAQMKKVMPEIGIAPESTVFVSGIGCSSRFPYYMNTYGIHGIHGRAPAIATGLRAVRPDLSVWVITGDGDALSIGGNHLMHAIRRNVDINIVLFNNRIYGLTKGQYSPTSPVGQTTYSTPQGAIDHPLDPIAVALGAEATFIARSIDVHTKHLGEILKAAAAHRGTSFVEVYQNCNVYNDLAFDHAADRKQRPEHVVELEHGKPLIFGTDADRAIRLNGFTPEVVPADSSDLLLHDAHTADPTLASILARMRYPALPEPIGILRQVERPCYEGLLEAQVREAHEAAGGANLNALLRQGDTWEVD